MVNIVERIYELMQLKGWTCYELGKQTGISTNAIYDWKKKGATPSLETVCLICEAMDITLSQFFCGTENMDLSDEEKKLLDNWLTMSDREKKSVFDMIETFKTLKRNG